MGPMRASDLKEGMITDLGAVKEIVPLSSHEVIVNVAPESSDYDPVGTGSFDQLELDPNDELEFCF